MLTKAESEDKKLIDENNNLKVEMKKRRKVDYHLKPLKESITMEQG